jgi:hypothetical protein
MKGDDRMQESELLLKLKESEGNSLVLGFNSDSQVDITYQTAKKLQEEGKIELIDLRKNIDNTLEIKAYVK